MRYDMQIAELSQQGICLVHCISGPYCIIYK